MSTTIREKDLEFVFGNSWSIRQHDKTPEANALLPIPGTAVVDFMGSYDSRLVVFFEVKDPRGHEADYAHADLQTLQPSGFPAEAESVARKFKDAAAAMAYCGKVPGFDLLYAQLTALLAQAPSEIALVLWQEMDATDPRWAAACSFFWTKLKQLLAKVVSTRAGDGRKVHLLRANMADYQNVLSDLQVNDLAGGAAVPADPPPTGP